MILLTIDAETAYGKSPSGRDVTLSKMTTEEYVRDKEFKVHGLGVKLNDRPAKYLTGKDLARFIKEFPWGKAYVLCHHAQFDGAILTWRCGVKPKLWLDTLSMMRALYPHESSSLSNMAKVLGLGEKGHELVSVKDKWVLTPEESATLGRYCINDVELTYAAFQKLKQGFPSEELRLIDTTVRMFTEPVFHLDPQLLEEEIVAEQERKADLLAKVEADKDTLMSNDRFAELLLTLGVDPPKKLSPSKVKDGRVDPDETGEEPVGLLPSFKAPKGASKEERDVLKEAKRVYPWAYAFGKGDEEFKMLLDHPDAQVQAVVEARMGVKSTLNETRAGRLLGISQRGAWPVYLSYCSASTFRYGGGDKVNPQNFTRGSRLRRAIMAPPGYLQAISDLSQIEARVLAVVSGETTLVAKFAAGEDIYCNDASMIFGVPVTKADKDKRFLGKCVRLGCGYGLGWAKFSQMVRIGMLGNEGVLFDGAMADTLGLTLGSFTSRHYDKAMSSKPSNLTEEAHLIHCACAKTIIDRYRMANPNIVRFWRDCQNIIPYLKDGDEGITIGREPVMPVVAGGIVMPNGLTMQYNGLKQHESGEWTRTTRSGRKVEQSKLYGGLITENLCQSLARIVITECMDKMRQAGIQAKLQVHDEVVAVAPEEQAEDVFAEMQRIMSVAPKWMPSLPLASEGGTDKRYVK